MPHQIAYTDAIVAVNVFLKMKPVHGRRELKIAAHIKAVLERILAKGQKQAYFRTIEAVRRYLLTVIQSMNDDQIGVITIRTNIEGKVGASGHYLGIDIHVP